MSKITVTGKSVEEAVESALSQLQTSKDKVSIRVIEESSKGFLGFGAKPATVEVELLSDIKEAILEDSPKISLSDEIKNDRQPEIVDNREEALKQARIFLEDVISEMGLFVEVIQKEEANFVHFELQGLEMGMLIGRRGQTLDALQYLANIVANRYSKQYIKIILDAENYRSRRKNTLEQLADRVAKKVIRTGKKVVLEPMNAAERKVIHQHLQNYAAVNTKSEGQDPHRRIIILPKY